MTENKSNDKSKQASKSESKIESLKLVARGRVNLDFSQEMSVVSTCKNVIRVENDKRYFDESLAHTCARITKYVDRLELFDESDQLVASVSCENVPREKVKISEKSTTEIYLDEIKSQRVFKVSHLSSESNEIESNEIETEVRKWKYRRDERRNEFIDQLKKAINKIDSTLVSLKQASSKSQEEIDLETELKTQQATAKATRAKLKKAQSDRKASK